MNITSNNNETARALRFPKFFVSRHPFRTEVLKLISAKNFTKNFTHLRFTRLPPPTPLNDIIYYSNLHRSNINSKRNKAIICVLNK